MVRGNISVEDQLLTSLQFDSRNPRFHSKQQIRQITKAFGVIVPLFDCYVESSCVAGKASPGEVL